LKFGARMNGDVTAGGGDIFCEDNVTVGGDAIAALTGDRDMMHQVKRWELSGLLTRADFVSAAIHVLVALTITTIGLLLVFLVPRFLRAIVSTLSQASIKNGA